MTIWGKVVGGTAGLMFGGPLGAAVGAAMGHAYDRMTASAWRNAWAFLPGGEAVRDMAERLGAQTRQSVFALAVLALGSALARADGPLNQAEEDAFRRMFGVSDAEADHIMVLLRRGVPLGDVDAQARRLASLFADSPEVLEELLAALVLLARADGPLNEAEDAFLSRLATQFGLPSRAWERARASAAGVSRGGADPHAVLGLTPGATEAEIRAAYRKLLRETHPDALMAQGMPAEFIEVANQRMAAINAAYDDILRLRGLKK